MKIDLPHRLRTRRERVKPAASAHATTLKLDEEERERLAELEARRVPFGFQLPVAEEHAEQPRGGSA